MNKIKNFVSSALSFGFVFTCSSMAMAANLNLNLPVLSNEKINTDSSSFFGKTFTHNLNFKNTGSNKLWIWKLDTFELKEPISGISDFGNRYDFRNNFKSFQPPSLLPGQNQAISSKAFVNGNVIRNVVSKTNASQIGFATVDARVFYILQNGAKYDNLTIRVKSNSSSTGAFFGGSNAGVKSISANANSPEEIVQVSAASASIINSISSPEITFTSPFDSLISTDFVDDVFNGSKAEISGNLFLQGKEEYEEEGIVEYIFADENEGINQPVEYIIKSESGDVLLSAQIDQLLYNPPENENEFWGILSSLKLAGVDEASPFYDPNLNNEIKSDYILAMDQELTADIEGEGDRPLYPYITLTPDVENLEAATDEFTQPLGFNVTLNQFLAFTEGKAEFEDFPNNNTQIPEPSLIVGIAFVGALGAVSTRKNKQKP